MIDNWEKIQINDWLSEKTEIKKISSWGTLKDAQTNSVTDKPSGYMYENTIQNGNPITFIAAATNKGANISLKDVTPQRRRK
ncbi:hypothetical protein Golomagni_05001 [Golovinomyces magnicellulatus]|nr:hypothetical protein Golomagni_05001 [Golovinomyces magnicellulatus]